MKIRCLNFLYLSFILTASFVTGCAGVNRTAQTGAIVIPNVMDESGQSISSRDLLLLRDIGGNNGKISVSLDGERVAFQIQQSVVSENRYNTGWFVAETGFQQKFIHAGNGGDPLILGEDTGIPTGIRTALEAKWSPDGKWFAYLLKRNGETQIWRSSADGRVQEQLTSNASDVRTFFWSKTGDRIYFEVGTPRAAAAAARKAEGEKGYLFDSRFLPFFSTRPVFEDPVRADVWDHVDDYSVAGIWLINVMSRQESPASEEGIKEYKGLSEHNRPEGVGLERDIHLARVEAKTSQTAWLENEDPSTFAGPSPPLRLFVQIKNGEEIRCSAQQCAGQLRQLIWSRDGAEIFFIRNEGVNRMRRGLYAWHPANDRIRIVLQTEDLLGDCELGVNRLICLHESVTTPRKIVAVNLSSGMIKTIFDPNPEFHNIQFGHVEKLEWKEALGADAAGHLVYPINYEEGRRYPLVIVQYQSRGFLRGGIGDEYPIHPLAANGFFVLSFDRPTQYDISARIADVYERERESWRDFWERKSALSALEVMITKLDARGLIDPTRVGITGLSDGAETVWYGLIHSNKFAVAAVSGGGLSQSFYYNLNSQTRKNMLSHSARLPAPEVGDDSRWREVSINFHTDRINTPILVQMSESEFHFATSNIGALQDASKPIEAYVFPDEYHIKWQPKHRAAIYERNIDWMNFWLRDVEDADPEKTAQYERWRKLREQHEANLAKLETAQ